MRDFRIDGVRMDSVENVASWDFVQSFKDLGRNLWRRRWADAGLDPAAGADARFIVVGEELSLPSGATAPEPARTGCGTMISRAVCAPRSSARALAATISKRA